MEAPVAGHLEITALAAQVILQAHLHHKVLTAAAGQTQAHTPEAAVAVVVHQGLPEQLDQDQPLAWVVRELPQALQVHLSPMLAAVGLALPMEELVHQVAQVEAALVVTTEI
jgi:hypothetical protein